MVGEPALQLTQEQLDTLDRIRELTGSAPLAQQLTKRDLKWGVWRKLHTHLHVREHDEKMERELASEIERLGAAVEPYEKQRAELAQASRKRSDLAMWGLLAGMGLQWGAFARSPIPLPSLWPSPRSGDFEADVVGVLVGHHGAHHLLCHLLHRHRRLHLLHHHALRLADPLLLLT